ncbi:MAG: hypothetical protein ACJAU0_002114 [Flavobacteriales bacterium]|jgi:hypothetical protein
MSFLPLLQLDSLQRSAERAGIADWINILTAVVASVVLLGTILFIRYYRKQNKGN